MPATLHVLDHPLASHYLAELRNVATPPETFRWVSRNLTTLLAVEATRHLRTRRTEIATPLEPAAVDVLDERLVVVPILRAGLGMLDAIVGLCPEVAVGYLGLERDEETAEASIYYRKLPDVKGRTVLLVDPMLATGGSAIQALEIVAAERPGRILMVSIVAAPEGVAAVGERFPDVEIVTAALDRELDARKYIRPGLGDFGDRLYGTS